uniref:Uncharacterized protein TCIL3000_7_5780 n=1 Tax=Trypanosoma congolense (strain IL3000) TaxID=1068625 RepID=G0UQV3_TRYCI|nr:unnamed protein product [Trypanosoma congolense IL3000]
MINTTKHTLQRTPLGTTLMVQSPSHPCTDSNESNGERYSNSRSSRMRTPTPQGRASRARSASSTPSLTKSQVSPCRKMVESCIVANSFGRGAADDTNKAAQDPQLLHGTVENTSKARNLRPVQIFTSSSAAPSQAEGPARQRRRTWSVERIATCKPGKVSYFSRTSSHYFSSSTSSHCSSAGNGQSSSKRHAAWTADPQHGAMSGESRLIQRRVVNLA